MDWLRLGVGLALGTAVGCGDDAAGTTAGNDGGSTSAVGSTGADSGSDSSGNAGATSMSGSSSDDGLDGSTGDDVPPPDCSDFMGAATPEQVAMTPRDDEEAELLAIEASEEIVAPTELYERALADLALIRADAPELSTIQARPRWRPDELRVSLDRDSDAALMAGTYRDWDCVNEHYGVVEVIAEGFFFSHVLHFEGRFNIPLVQPDYMAVETVTSTESAITGGDGPDVCMSIDGDLHTYIFDDARGDCPAGCTEHAYTGYTVDGRGTLELLGVWAPDPEARPDPPPWFTAAEPCTQWL
ncbi:MAG: hypothetical protein AAF799_47400 [Myxococcota bacterium]